MQSNAARAGIGVAAVVIVVLGFVLLSGGDDGGDDTTSTPTVATTDTGGESTAGNGGEPDRAGGGSAGSGQPAVQIITVKDGQPEGGIADLTFNKGDDIDFVVDSDTAAEVHFHGYDVMQDVEAGGKTEFSVPADIEGIFEVELEETATQIAEITVNP